MYIYIDMYTCPFCKQTLYVALVATLKIVRTLCTF